MQGSIMQARQEEARRLIEAYGKRITTRLVQFIPIVEEITTPALGTAKAREFAAKLRENLGQS